MPIDFASLDPDARYFLLTQTIIPRPIAWVLTRNVDESLNLALGCRLVEIKEVGPDPRGRIFGAIETLHLADEVVHLEGQRVTVDPKAVNPLLRLGAFQYATLGEILVRKRPR